MGVVLVAGFTLNCSGSPTQPTPLTPPVATPPSTTEPPTSPAPPPAPPQVPGPRLARTRYLAFGDSVTAGTTSPSLSRLASAGLPQSFPFKLQELLSARYLDQRIVVENEGKPGEAAADAVNRFPVTLSTVGPEVVILMHGVNDVTFLGLPGVSRVAGYLDTMARAARLSGAQVILCTLPPHRPGGFRAADPNVITRYNQALREIARGEGAWLVDFERDVDLALIGSDGLHPTEAGYTRMAQLLFDTVRLRLEVTTAR